MRRDAFIGAAELQLFRMQNALKDCREERAFNLAGEVIAIMEEYRKRYEGDKKDEA